MAITYVYDKTESEDLVSFLKSNLPKEVKGKNAKVYITDNIEDLDKVVTDIEKKAIVITRNCTTEFVTKALSYTEFLMYRADEYDKIKIKLLKCLGVNK